MNKTKKPIIIIIIIELPIVNLILFYVYLLKSF